MKAGEQTADVTYKCDNPQMDEQTGDFPSVANERGTASVGDTLYQTKKWSRHLSKRCAAIQMGRYHQAIEEHKSFRVVHKSASQNEFGDAPLTTYIVDADSHRLSTWMFPGSLFVQTC